MEIRRLFSDRIILYKNSHNIKHMTISLSRILRLGSLFSISLVNDDFG